MIRQLLEKLGIDFSVFKSGRLKDMSGFWRNPTAEEESKFRGLIEEIYDSFVSVVAKGRRLDEEKVRELATGEVFTGRGARERALVDELGDFDTALDLAAQLGRTRRRPMWVRPRQPLLERFVGRAGGPSVAQGIVSELDRVLAGGLYLMDASYGSYPSYE